MKKRIGSWTLGALLLLLAAGNVSAEDMKGKFGLTLHGGFNVPMNGELSSTLGLRDTTIDTDVGLIIGGGILYGITKNFALDLELLYSESEGKYLGFEIVKFSTVDLALGGSYHFDLASKWAPYLGVGVDVLINSAEPSGILSGLTSPDAQTTFGGHLKAGVDYFFTKNFALNAEMKALVSGSSEVTVTGGTLGDYQPTSFSGLFGFRFVI